MITQTVRAANQDVALIALGAELAECDARRRAHFDAGRDDDDAEHWDLRDKIAETPATTVQGLVVKAEAIRLAERWDSANYELSGVADLWASIQKDLSVGRTPHAAVAP